MDNLGNPSQAAVAFARAVNLGPPGAIAEDALARLVEAEGKAGQAEKARADAKKYLTQFPSGRHEYAVRRWLEQP
jgi:outer membrane protein assembly factor BamD (BamD/ComL family)